jgi:hypothetical protein
MSHDLIKLHNTYLLTGLPRAGTTLCCHILNGYENTVALHEPLTPTDFNAQAGRSSAAEKIQQFALSARDNILRNGIALTRQKNGQVPENPVSYHETKNGLRQMDVTLGEIAVQQKIKNENFNLIVKHNALFAGLLPELHKVIPVFAIVRNPLSVLASWNSVDLPVNNGRVPAGEMFCPELKILLDKTTDVIERQLHILEWFCQQYTEHLPNRVMYYENFIVNPQCIGDFLQLTALYTGEFTQRESRNAAYNVELMEILYKRLINFGDAIWQFYSRDQVELLMSNIRAAQ